MAPTPTTWPPCWTWKAWRSARASTARTRCCSSTVSPPPAAPRWPSTTPMTRSTRSSPPCTKCAPCSPSKNMPGLDFRNATPGDVDAIVALVTSAYRGEASRAGWTTEADLLDGARIAPGTLLADIRREHSIVLLAETTGAAPGELSACAHVAIEDGAGYFG